MWCPDDTGRDSWDWVEPPVWERACFNSPEWGGGCAPVITDPLQIVLLLLLLFCHDLQKESVTPQLLSVSTNPQPSNTHSCECSRAPKKSISAKIRTWKVLKIQVRRNNVQISKCSSRAEEKRTVHFSADCRQSSGTQRDKQNQ